MNTASTENPFSASMTLAQGCDEPFAAYGCPSSEKTDQLLTCRKFGLTSSLNISTNSETSLSLHCFFPFFYHLLQLTSILSIFKKCFVPVIFHVLLFCCRTAISFLMPSSSLIFFSPHVMNFNPKVNFNRGFFKKILEHRNLFIIYFSTSILPHLTHQVVHNVK